MILLPGASPPPLPLALRAFNGAGRLLGKTGVRLPRLDRESLLERAARATGLDDFGDDFFREPLRLLLDGFEREAALTTLGRVIARNDVLRLLELSLRGGGNPCSRAPCWRESGIGGNGWSGGSAHGKARSQGRGDHRRRQRHGGLDGPPFRGRGGPGRRRRHPRRAGEGALWLASEESAFVNGHELVVDGGLVAGRRYTEAQESWNAFRELMGLPRKDYPKP